jgi:lipopolysaccharide/colanic/teichoic acid biosynthesis glycosyltransferase
MLTKHQIAYLFLKRTFDIFGSALGIILLAPLMILLAIITKCTSNGPALFRQRRLGKNEKPFTLLKFRSMRLDAKQIPPDQMTIEQQQAMVTNWGKFIRKTSLDELPQLFNIFFGKMSFIGPRPSQDREHEPDLVNLRNSYIPNGFAVRPGLGGYSQVYLNRDHDPAKKSRYDSYYITHIGLRLDIKIFFLSLMSLFGHDVGR